MPIGAFPGSLLRAVALGALLGGLAACSSDEDAEVKPVTTPANCVKPAEPAVPDGRTASFDDMSAAARTVAEYLYDATRYKNCLESAQSFTAADAAAQEMRAVEERFEVAKAAFQQRQ